jgi:hypothetical protein
MTTVPSSAAMIEPWSKPAASGTRASIVAIAVMRMGRIPLSKPPACFERPGSRSCSVIADRSR